MEVIKKTVKIAMTTGGTVPCTFRNPLDGIQFTGCTDNKEECNCYLIIPDSGATYTFKILLKSEIKDLGFFDAAKKEDIKILDIK